MESLSTHLDGFLWRAANCEDQSNLAAIREDLWRAWLDREMSDRERCFITLVLTLVDSRLLAEAHPGLSSFYSLLAHDSLRVLARLGWL